MKHRDHPLQMTFTWPAEAAPEPGETSGQCQWVVVDGFGPRQCGNTGRIPASPPVEIALCWQHRRFVGGLLKAFVSTRPELVRQMYWDTVIEPKFGDFPDPGRSVVYFIEREGLVKIGTSTNLEHRIREIGRGGSMALGMTVGPVRLLATMPGDHRHEGYLHRRFSTLRVGGEWFVPDEDLCEFIGTRHNANRDLLHEIAVRHGLEEEEQAS